LDSVTPLQSTYHKGGVNGVNGQNDENGLNGRVCSNDINVRNDFDAVKRALFVV